MTKEKDNMKEGGLDVKMDKVDSRWERIWGGNDRQARGGGWTK